MAEGYSVGEQNGKPVEESSPYYQNNAKYYAERAGTKTARTIAYDGTASGISANNVQGAIDETVTKVNSKADASALDAKADKTQLSNRNLLDNGWFTNPVNQRGQSSYNGSASYGLDRWWQQNDTNVAVHNGYITRSGKWQIEQILDNEIEANTYYTLSALVRNYSSDESSGFRLIISKNSTILLYTNVPKTEFETSEWKLVSWTFNVNQNGNKVAFGGADGKPYSIDIKAIKLEKGSISTLANDVAPNYAEELIKCQGSKADSTDTYANDGVVRNNGAFDYVRRGNVVTIKLTNGATIGSDGKTLTQLIPLGYRPQTQLETIIKVYDGSGYVDARWYAYPNGQMTVVGLYGTNISGIQIAYSVCLSMTYVI